MCKNLAKIHKKNITPPWTDFVFFSEFHIYLPLGIHILTLSFTVLAFELFARISHFSL
eukprot:TRINITY_DN5823_c0_g1_i1.p1 TRINITY_DN5823_c0_g1~~TRINITY_DN5823_c0_g1_i1.p1  ORF type:complete len:58 (+),score=8.18 TRINITY_DN5823_c0_g1_i1:105-278(+)